MRNSAQLYFMLTVYRLSTRRFQNKSKPIFILHKCIAHNRYCMVHYFISFKNLQYT